MYGTRGLLERGDRGLFQRTCKHELTPRVSVSLLQVSHGPSRRAGTAPPGRCVHGGPLLGHAGGAEHLGPSVRMATRHSECQAARRTGCPKASRLSRGSQGWRPKFYTPKFQTSDPYHWKRKLQPKKRKQENKNISWCSGPLKNIICVHNLANILDRFELKSKTPTCHKVSEVGSQDVGIESRWGLETRSGWDRAGGWDGVG